MIRKPTNRVNPSRQTTLIAGTRKPGLQTSILGQHRSKRGVWIFAFILTLILHSGIYIAAHFLNLLEPALAQHDVPDPIQVVFAPEPESEPQASDEPTFFTELPPDRADEPPERADFLSNVTSRARDEVPGGETEALPRQDGYSDAPHIRMDQGTAQGITAAMERPEDPVTPEEIESKEMFEESAPETESSFLDPSRTETAHPMTTFREQIHVSDSTQPRIQPFGMSDISQEAMSSPGGNTDLSGIISLNTTEWAYGYWMQQFRRAVIRNWIAPLGYHLGLIHGYTDCELEIALTGELIRCDVVARDGHQALHDASVDALQKAGPYSALPSHFPEESLILQIRMSYKAMPSEAQRMRSRR